jgi:ring-1,2-phenylacetyl-CoA epoxidase subunit PaaC
VSANTPNAAAPNAATPNANASSASVPDATALRPDVREALIDRLTAMADDELVLGHRDAEWTGHGPILEEDIALANLAQDEIGHAMTWYGLRTELDGSDADRLVYFRDAPAYRNAWLVERPRGDWAFTMVRQFLFDTYEAELLSRLRESAHAPLAEAAAKVLREETFHLRHSGLWLERLARGTDESRARLAAATDVLWPLMPQLLAPLPGDPVLVETGIWPEPRALEDAVMARVRAAFAAVDVMLPALPAFASDAGRIADGAAGRPADPRSTHPGGLADMLAKMQSVARADPGADGW